MKACRSGILLVALYAGLPAWADTQFRAGHLTRNDIPRGKGQCDIRLIVDEDVEVTVRGDFVTVRTLNGRDARDDGSECNAPLPNRKPEDFLFEKKDGRGEVRLIEGPSRRSDYQAVIRIHDGDSGEGKYHFRLSWRLDDGHDFHSSDRRPNSFDDDAPSRVEGPHEGGGLAWNNTFHSGGRGRGFSTWNGKDSDSFTEASVDIDRGGKIFVSFRTDRGKPLTFSGSLMAPEGEMLKADITSGDRADLRGPMYLSRDAKGSIYRITADITNGQDRLHLDWDRR
jgi:hypothetical protein